MGEKIEETYKHKGANAAELRKAVMAREAEIAETLGGPVRRMHRFINGGDDVVFIWGLK